MAGTLPRMPLASLGYRPRVPVTAAGLADPHQRREWIDSDVHHDTPLDVFVTEPFDFRDEYDRSLVVEIAPGRPIHVVRLTTLLRMKDEAGRPQDVADAAELRHLHGSGDP